LQNFNSLATAILQAPSKKKKKQTKRPAYERKPRKSHNYDDSYIVPVPVGAGCCESLLPIKSLQVRGAAVRPWRGGTLMVKDGKE
jgi:hypothetical protein